MAAAATNESAHKGLQPTKPEPVSKKRKVIDFRLATKMEDSRCCRDLLRQHGRIIVWQSKDQVNVMSLDALALNHKVMCIVADHHCAETKVVKPPAVNFLKAQAWSMSKKGDLLLLGWVNTKLSFQLQVCIYNGTL